MKINNYLTAWKNLDALLRFYKFAFLVCVGCIVFLVIYLQYVQNKTRTIIIPTHLANKIEVSDYEGDPVYVRSMSQYFVDLLYDYTPFNVDKRFNEFLSFVDADIYSDMLKILTEKKIKVKKVGITQDFQTEEVYVLNENRCLVKGSIRRYVNSDAIGNEVKNIILSYKFKNGGIYVASVQEIDDREYHSIISNK